MTIFSSTVNCNDCIDNFSIWFKNHNGKISNKIKIDHEPLSGYGIYSSKSTIIHKNEHIASIPLTLLITSGHSMDLLQQRIFNREMSRKKIKVSVCKKSKDILLSLGLLIEENNNLTKWKPYFNCLPHKNDKNYVNNLLIAWPKQKIVSTFQNSKIIQLIEGRKEFVQNSYLNIVNNYKQIYFYLNNFTLNDWIWSLSIVWTRSFHVTINGEKTKCLVPFGDFFNFNNNLNVENIQNINVNALDLMLYDVESAVSQEKNAGFLIFKPLSTINGETQIYAQYTPNVINNLYSLLLDYGICLKIKNNENNEIILNPLHGIWISVKDMVEAKNQQIYGGNINNLELKYKQMIGHMIQSIDAQQIYIGINQKDTNVHSLYLLSFILSSTKDALQSYGNELRNALNEINNGINAKVYNKVFDSLIPNKNGSLVEKGIMHISYRNLMDFLQDTMMKYETTIIQDLVYLDSVAVNDCGLNIRLTEKFILLHLYIAAHMI